MGQEQAREGERRGERRGSRLRGSGVNSQRSRSRQAGRGRGEGRTRRTRAGWTDWLADAGYQTCQDKDAGRKEKAEQTNGDLFPLRGVAECSVLCLVVPTVSPPSNAPAARPGCVVLIDAGCKYQVHSTTNKHTTVFLTGNTSALKSESQTQGNRTIVLAYTEDALQQCHTDLSCMERQSAHNGAVCILLAFSTESQISNCPVSTEVSPAASHLQLLHIVAANHCIRTRVRVNPCLLRHATNARRPGLWFNRLMLH